MKFISSIFIILLLLLGSCSGNRTDPATETLITVLSQSDSLEIVLTFTKTEEAWNNSDLEGFMEAYWKSDSLVFLGSRGPTYGYKATLDNYKLGYPDPEAMGKLKFDIIKLYQIDHHTALLIGKYYLTRTIGDMQGFYTLVWKKIDGKWLIVSDHSSGTNVND